MCVTCLHQHLTHLKLPAYTPGSTHQGSMRLATQSFWLMSVFQSVDVAVPDAAGQSE